MIAAHRCVRSKPQRAFADVKMTEMANQIKVGGYFDLIGHLSHFDIGERSLRFTR